MGLTIFGASNFTQSHWVPEPNGRGTYNLLSTCLLTLGLCVYSSIHLNIPEYKASWTILFLRRTKWVLIALLAPEFVVYNAWRQRDRAKQILCNLKSHHGQDQTDNRLSEETKQISGPVAFSKRP